MASLPASAGYGLPGFFVDHPTTNSREWTSAVMAAGGLINTDVDFRAMNTGVLNGTFYETPAHNDGVRLSASDSSFDQVVAGPGPGQGSQFGVVSVGEGKSSAPQYLQSTSPGFGGGASLTISFDAPAMAVGLFTIDYFGSDPPTNQLSLSIFSGKDGKGTLLGTATAVRENFQPNGLYFMGYASTTADIGSAVLMRGPDIDGDTIGVGSIIFANAPVPEPSAIALLCVGGAVFMGWAARRRRGAA
ncbi:MAG TPA: PEP-CTERM sorting domain-containing protein [Isosphaeraceae bacterium]